MCITPVAIKNKNYGLAKLGLNCLKDCESAYLNIPCGHCLDCSRKKQSALIQRVTMMEEEHFIAFATLTYNQTSLPVHEEYVVSKDGEQILIRFPYAKVEDIQTLVRNLRQGSCCPSASFGIPFSYLAVSELGGEKGRPHFHLLLFFKKKYFDNDINKFNLWCQEHQFDLLKNWCRNKGCRKKPLWVPICTYKKAFKNGHWNTNYDFHAVMPRATEKGNAKPTQDVAWYVTKYVMKADQRNRKRQQFLKMNCFDDDYIRIWNKIKCRMLSSKGIGAPDDMDFFNTKSPIIAYVRQGIDKTLGLNPTPEFPFFIKKDGSTWPLCDYYKKRMLTMKDIVKFCKDFPCGQAKIPDKYLTPEQKFSRIHHFQQIQQKLYDKQSLFLGLVPDSAVSDDGDFYSVDVELLRCP